MRHLSKFWKDDAGGDIGDDLTDLIEKSAVPG